MTAALSRVSFEAKLTDVDQLAELEVRSTSWFITHGFGKPAAGTYTEVAFDEGAVDPLQTHLEHAEILRVLDAVVRGVAVQLYGTAFAFIYGPSEYTDAVARFELRRRERAYVTMIGVHS